MVPPAVNSQIEVQKEARILTQASAQAKHAGWVELQGNKPLHRQALGEVLLWPAHPGELAKGRP
jgi:hypothetical protein